MERGLSQRTAWNREASAYAQARRRAEAAGEIRFDLAETNPTRVGLRHPDAVYRNLSDPADAVYRPTAFGLPEARAAVASYYGDAVSPDRVWLTASTSEAYAQLLTLLADPGDAVALPRPGYPLLDTLADAVGVRRLGYPVRYDGRWHVDVAELAAVAGDEDRLAAIISVSPNNPTGNVLTPQERAAVERVCAPGGPAHIVDEVFADYPLIGEFDPEQRRRRLPTDAGLCLTVSGLSKVAALPQLKLSWVVVQGSDDTRVTELLDRAQHLADAFLSVATPVQRALPSLLAAAESMQRRIRNRIRANLSTLRDATRGRPWDVLPADAGWTAMIRLPQTHDDEAWAIRFLEAGLATLPGFLFDVPPTPPRIAVSLLPPPDTFADGVELLDTVMGRALA